MLGTVPYKRAAISCDNGTGVTSPRQVLASAQVVLADRQKTVCYFLGPTLLTGEHVSGADVVVSPTTAAWEINIHFGNDDFVNKIVARYVGRQIAIVVDGVVQSAPAINAGIAGRDVTISSNFDETTARVVAVRIAPPGTVHVVPTTTPTTRLVSAFTRRCRAIAPRLGFGSPISRGSTITVATARSAFARAHEPVPAELARRDANSALVLCQFMQLPVTPPSICPNGHIVYNSSAAERSIILYAVDANLTAVRLPELQYLYPAITVPSYPTSCAGSSSP